MVIVIICNIALSEKEKTNSVASRANAGDLLGVSVTTSPGRLEEQRVSGRLSPWRGEPTLQGGLFPGLPCALIIWGQTSPCLLSQPRARSQGWHWAPEWGRGQIGEKGNPDREVGQIKTRFVYLLWFGSGLALMGSIFLFFLSRFPGVEKVERSIFSSFPGFRASSSKLQTCGERGEGRRVGWSGT